MDRDMNVIPNRRSTRKSSQNDDLHPDLWILSTCTAYQFTSLSVSAIFHVHAS